MGLQPFTLPHLKAFVALESQPVAVATSAELITGQPWRHGPSGSGVQGVFWKTGVIWDIDDDFSEREDDEWANANLRESVARSGIIRCRKVSSTNYFTKGKLNELGLYIKENNNINVVYVNTSLTALQ